MLALNAYIMTASAADIAALTQQMQQLQLQDKREMPFSLLDFVVWISWFVSLYCKLVFASCGMIFKVDHTEAMMISFCYAA